MIRKISFENFYSFKDRQEIDFTTTKKKSSDYYEAYDGTLISKVAGFAGSNASGKTNAMRIFGFISYILTVSNKAKGITFTPFKNYSFIKNNTSLVEIEFENDTHLFKIYLEIRNYLVIKEFVSFKSLKKRSRFTTLIDRNEREFNLNPKYFTGVTKKKMSSIQNGVSAVAFINTSYDIPILSEIGEYFSLFQINFSECGETIHNITGLELAAETYLKSPEVKTRMEQIIRDFNIGIEDFLITKNSDGKYDIKANHIIGTEKYLLPIDYESRGTRALFYELGRIIFFISEGTVMVSDEIETGLHPEAVNKLIQFIVDELAESKKQFIFSSHSLEFMKKFDAQQIFLVEKENNVSEVFRLDEMKFRSEDNYFAKYQSGVYGAYPKIRI